MFILPARLRVTLSHTAFKAARELARDTGQVEVPHHLRNAPTQLMKDIGMGAGYRYAHDEANAYASGEIISPNPCKQRSFIFPTERGFEKRIKDKLAQLAQLDQAS